MSVEIRAELPADRDRSLEIERLAFGSEEEAAIVEALRDDDGRSPLSPTTMVISSGTSSSAVRG